MKLKPVSSLKEALKLLEMTNINSKMYRNPCMKLGKRKFELTLIFGENNHFFHIREMDVDKTHSTFQIDSTSIKNCDEAGFALLYRLITYTIEHKLYHEFLHYLDEQNAKMMHKYEKGL